MPVHIAIPTGQRVRGNVQREHVAVSKRKARAWADGGLRSSAEDGHLVGCRCDGRGGGGAG
jgi:hypothetical protein